jgi:hypothetical protein
MISAEAIRPMTMVAPPCFRPAREKVARKRQHLTKVAEYLSDGRGARGWDPRCSTSAVGRAVVEAGRSATLHDHPLTPEV